jgi:hypothetical protein
LFFRPLPEYSGLTITGYSLTSGYKSVTKPVNRMRGLRAASATSQGSGLRPTMHHSTPCPESQGANTWS